MGRVSRRVALSLIPILLLGAFGAVALVRSQGTKKERQAGASFHWQQALQALQSEDFATAKRHLSQCLQVWPINAEANFLMARTYRRADDRSAWQLYLHRADVLGWDRESLRLERDLMQAQLGNLRSVENRLIDDLDSLPAEEEVIREALAKGYLKAQLLNPLLQLTRTWIEHYPDHWQPRLYRGRVFQLGHSTDRAIAEYRQVLERKPDHLDAHVELAEALMVNAEFQEALEHFQTYLQQRPDEPSAQIGLANCQFSLGQFEAARATLVHLFSGHKEHAAGCFVRAKVELALQQPDDALHWLKRAEALAPCETDILYYLVLVLQRLGKQEEAKKYEEKLQDARRQFDRLDGIKKQILTEPRNATLRQEAGAVALELGRTEEAMSWLESALRLEPNHVATHKLLADYYAKLGDSQRAAYHRRRAGE